MATKTHLTSDEVAELLMVSPINVFEWVQQAKLHVHLKDGLDTVFSREDLRFFAQMRGLNISRPDNNKLRVLIVDADLRVTRFLVDLFHTLSETIEATAVHSAFEAGQRLQNDNPDIVLVDLMLSQHEGIEMCRRIKSDSSSRHVRLITMTEQQDDDHLHRSLMLGAVTCLAKPIDHQKLFEAMGLCMGVSEKVAALQQENFQ